MSDYVDEKWLAEQAHAAGNAIIDRYGWVVTDDGEADGMDQETVIRMLVSTGWVEGFKAGRFAGRMNP